MGMGKNPRRRAQKPVEPVCPGPPPLKPGLWSACAARPVERLVVPVHRTYRGLGHAGFHRLHYCDWGQADNPRVVVCVHGSRGNARDFDVLARGLAADFRVICPDLAGRRNGEWLGTAMRLDFPQLLADLNALLARLDVDEVDWIGTSLGGLLGRHLAGQDGTPIRRLMLLGDDAPASPQEIAGVRHFLLEEAGTHRRETWECVAA
jgi:pimeloyl-ACP methyl ester carboxylesterase